MPTSSTASYPCVIDPTRPCGLCAAPAQELCPYPYLLDDAAPDQTSRESEVVQVLTTGPSSLP